jgi:hypothetical protein
MRLAEPSLSGYPWLLHSTNNLEHLFMSLLLCLACRVRPVWQELGELCKNLTTSQEVATAQLWCVERKAGTLRRAITDRREQRGVTWGRSHTCLMKLLFFCSHSSLCSDSRSSHHPNLGFGGKKSNRSSPSVRCRCCNGESVRVL